MNRIDRISALLIQLQSKKVVKAQDVADRFHISLRTVYRDIHTLIEAGVPIIGEAGIGYSMASGYKLPPVMFTEEEAFAFLTAEKLVEKLTDKITKQNFSSAMYKIKAILRSSEKDSISEIENSIAVVENKYLPKRSDNNQFLQEILKCVRNKNIIDISYFTNHSQEVSDRSIEPIGIFFKSGSWHLVAFCLLRNDYRNFRVDRIRNLKPTIKHFKKNHPSLENYLKQMALDEREVMQVVLRIKQEDVKKIGDQKYYMGYVSEKKVGDDVEMIFMSNSMDGFARWYMMIGDVATIVSPQELKNKVKEILKAIKNKM